MTDFGFCLEKHRKNCECCLLSLFVKGHYECYDCCSQLNCDQCLKGHKTLEVLADELLAGEVLAGGVLAVDF